MVNTPVYRASTILYPNVAALDARDMPFTYGRRGNPTLKSLEEAINALGGRDADLLCSVRSKCRRHRNSVRVQRRRSPC